MPILRSQTIRGNMKQNKKPDYQHVEKMFGTLEKLLEKSEFLDDLKASIIALNEDRCDARELADERLLQLKSLKEAVKPDLSRSAVARLAKVREILDTQ